MSTAASMAGAYKALLESLGLGVAVYRDGAPTNPNGDVIASSPFVVVTEQIGLEEGVSGSDLTVELVQVDLYQESRRATGGRVVSIESYTLPEGIAAALRGRGLEDYSPWHIYGTTAVGRRWPPSENLVRHTWTVTVTRSRDRKAT